MQFANVIGQSELKSYLVQMMRSERLPHAMMFIGKEGCGKLAMAIALAQYVLCEHKTDDDACGTCMSCRKVNKLIHPDLHFSYPTIGSKVKSEAFLPQWRKAMMDNPYLNVNQWLQIIGAENKQGNITTDECNHIIKKLSLKIFEGSHKILIQWLPEYLGKEGNRLLKLIEEPPENTLFIFVAQNQDLILNTILSRCQVVKIKPLTDEEISTALVEKANISIEKANAITPLAEGNFNEALHLQEQETNDNATLFLDWMRRCYIGQGVEMMAWVETFAKLGRENQKHFLRYALHFMREYMILKMTGNPQVRLQQQELTTAKNLTKVIAFHQIEAITQLLTDYSYYIERNANPKILFLDASIRMNKILRKK